MPGAFGTADEADAEGGGRWPSRAPTASTSSPRSPRRALHRRRPARCRVVAYDFGIKTHDPAPPRRRSPPSRSCRRPRRPPRCSPASPTACSSPTAPATRPRSPYAVDAIARAARREVPVFGICLGHQLLGRRPRRRAPYKLPFGHHGGNHPVRHLATGRVEITSQNHNFAVAADSLAGRAEVTHVNLNDGVVRGPAGPRRPGLQRAVPPRGRARAPTTPLPVRRVPPSSSTTGSAPNSAEGSA